MASRITDGDMRYFQFKARDHFLVIKENHEWNEFCKNNFCSCSSCQALASSKSLKDVGIQVSSKMPISNSNQYRNMSIFQGKEFPSALDEIKSKLENISITLSDIKQYNLIRQTLDSVPVKPSNFPENKWLEKDSALSSLNDQRRSILKSSLLSSLNKLHSFAKQNSPQPVSVKFSKSKNSSFFLPHDLQKKRCIARKAYLASLIDKPKMKAKDAGTCSKPSKKGNNKLPPHSPSKTKKKKSVYIYKQVEPKPTTLVESEKVERKDEHIEKAVDDIVNDLLGEELLEIRRIKEIKKDTTFVNKIEEQNTKNYQLHMLSPESKAQLRKIPFFNLEKKLSNKMQLEKSSNNKIDSKENLQYCSGSDTQNSTYEGKKDPKSKDKTIQAKHYQTLHINPELSKNVKKQRKKYWLYLKKQSRTKDTNFDPVIISNMVAESLLDDCIGDISEELQNIPSFLIKDLINLEFALTL